MPIRWIAVLRDALAIVVAVSFASAFLAGALGAGGEPAGGAQRLATYAVLAAGFCVAGCLSPARRFAHLGLVAVAVWAIPVAIAMVSGVEGWAGSQLSWVLAILVSMLLGGALSLAIVRPPGPQEAAGGPPREGP